MAHAQWGVVVRSADTGETIYARNPAKLMMPASNMKIVTTAAAAHVLGWDARFTTTLETNGAIDGDTLRGDLVIRGSGDPTINRRGGRAEAVLDAWAAALRAQGIHRIAGRVVGDDWGFEDDGLGAGWMWDDLQFPYAAPVGALQFDENTAALTVSPGLLAGDPAFVQLPPGTGLQVVNRTFTAPGGVPAAIKIRRRVDRPVIEVHGSVPLPVQEIDGEPVGERPYTRPVAVANPTLFFTQAVRDGLIARGVAVAGEAVDRDDLSDVENDRLRGSRRVLARSESPPLSEIVAVVNKDSQNQYAETLLKAIDVARGGSGTSTGGRVAIAEVLREWALDPGALLMADGSGMSRYNYLSPDLLAGILARVHTDPGKREQFVASLPMAGRDGTLAERLRGTPAEGNAAAKTGSLANVRALSGYLRTRDGETLIFVMLANNFSIPGPTVTWIVDLAVEVLANFTRGQSGYGSPGGN